MAYISPDQRHLFKYCVAITRMHIEHSLFCDDIIAKPKNITQKYLVFSYKTEDDCIELYDCENKLRVRVMLDGVTEIRIQETNEDYWQAYEHMRQQYQKHDARMRQSDWIRSSNPYDSGYPECLK